MTSTRSFFSHVKHWVIFILVCLISPLVFPFGTVSAGVSPVVLTISGVSGSCATSHQFNWSDLPNSLSPYEDKKDLSPGFHYKVVNSCGGNESLFLQRGIEQMAGIVWYSQATTSETNLLANNFQLSDGSSAYLYIPANMQILNSPLGNFKELVLRASGLFLPFATRFTVGNSVPPDVIPPEVVEVKSPSNDGSYRAGQEIIVEVYFSEPVTVSSITGTPKIEMETGEVDNFAVYNTGSGTSVLSFNYRVQSGDYSVDLDYFSSSSLHLNGSSIVDAAGNAAVISMPVPGHLRSISASSQLILDTESPSIAMTRINTSTLGLNDIDSIDFVISESVHQFNENSIEIVDGILRNFEGSLRHYSVEVSARRDAEGMIQVSIPENTFADEAGNRNIASDFLLIPFYTIRENVAISPDVFPGIQEVAVINASTDVQVAQPKLEIQNETNTPQILQLKTLPATGVRFTWIAWATFMLLTGGFLLVLAPRRRGHQ